LSYLNARFGRASLSLGSSLEARRARFARVLA
jgi:hypothetical protein